MRASRGSIEGPIRGFRASLRARFPRRAALLAVALCVLAAPAAWAIAPPIGTPVGGSGGAYGGYLDLLCDGDCGSSGLPDATKPGGGFFDFELGLVGRKDGFDLSLVTEGAVYLVGLLDAEEIVLQTTGSVVVDLDALQPILNPPRDDGGVIICACVEVVGGGGSGSAGGEITIGSGGDLVLRPRASVGFAAGGDLALRAGIGDVVVSAGDITLDAGLVVAHAALGGIAPPAPSMPALSVTRTGDVYLDLSGVRLGRLFVEAADGIQVGPVSPRPVPEPGPALLIGLGLATLGTRGRRG